MGVGGQWHTLAALALENRPGAHHIGVWLGPLASLDSQWEVLHLICKKILTTPFSQGLQHFIKRPILFQSQF
jgi:hypothetical protein